MKFKKLIQEVEIRKEGKNIFIKIPENEQEFLLLEWKHIKGGEGTSERKPFQMEIKKPDITYSWNLASKKCIKRQSKMYPLANV